jgi:hypothetical protein
LLRRIVRHEQVFDGGVMRRCGILCLCLFVLAGCSRGDVELAKQARTSLLGMSEVDLESCLRLPDQKVTEGKTTLFMYNANSSHSLSLTIPVIDFVGASFSGYCHATFRFEKDRVIAVHYSGDTDDPLGGGQDAVCAPIVRSCFAERASSQP